MFISAAQRMAAKLRPRVNPTTIRVGLKPNDWLKLAAVSFSGLLGGTCITPKSSKCRDAASTARQPASRRPRNALP